MQAPRKLVPRSDGPRSAAPPPPASHIVATPTVLLEDSMIFNSSQTPSASQVMHRTPRVRTILTAEAEEEAIQLTSEGKVTAKNAWSVKLLDGIHGSVNNALSSTHIGQEDAAKFTKLGNLVEGGAKIWSHRVEHTYAHANRVARRLLRNDDGEEENAGEGAGEAAEGDNRRAPKRARKKERTIAESLNEINIDDAAKAQALMQTGGVSAQFRAITEKFEQGHAKGLLLHNAPMGSVGNLILDVDYSRTEQRYTPPPTAAVGGSPSRLRRPSSIVGDVATPPARLSAVIAEEAMDRAGVDYVVVLAPAQETSWGRLSGGPVSESAAVLAVSQRPSFKAEPNPTAPELSPRFRNDDPGLSPRGSLGEVPDYVPTPNEGDPGYDDDGGADMNDYEDDDYASNAGSLAASRAGSTVRDIVSGATDLAFYDRSMGEQLSVAADDPESWFPMSQVNSSAPVQYGANLQKIRKATLLQQKSTSAPPAKKVRIEDDKSAVTTIEAFLAPSDVLAKAANDTRLMNARRENLSKPVSELRELFLYKRSTEVARQHNILLPDTDSKGTLPWWLPHSAVDVAGFFQPFATPSVEWNVLTKRVATAEDAARLVRQPGRTSTAVVAAINDVDAGYTCDMPLRVFDDDEMMGDMMGDDGLIDDDDDNYAAGFDLPRPTNLNHDDDDQHESTLGHFIPASSAAAPVEGELELMVRPEMIRALESHHATVPTQVDVVRLRRIMWQQTQRLVRDQAPEPIMVPNHEGEGHSNSAQGNKRRRFGKLKNQNRQQALKRNREDDEQSSESEEVDEEGYHCVPMHRFSDVVAAMLPQVPSVSTTGSLSPAFFFFSLLFLANEHGILLENVPGDVREIYISGILNGPTPTAIATA